MGEQTAIAWCDHTMNFWLGCTVVGPPCDFCYARDLDARYQWGVKKADRVAGVAPHWGPGKPRHRTAESNWRQPYLWARKAKADGVRRRVFSLSLGDWLDNEAPQQWRVDMAKVIDETPELDWLLLTKRIGNFGKLSPWWSGRQVPRNVWLGITCGDQEEYDRDWPKLAAIAAPVRFISYEPALGPLLPLGHPKPDWVICGGESGRTPRMMDERWAGALRGYCEASGVAFFMKQMSALAPIPDWLMLRQFPQPVQR